MRLKNFSLAGNFLKARDGAAAVEFALISPTLLLLLIGGIEFLMVMFVNISMEGGLRQAARFGVTGAETPAARQAAIVEILDRHTYGFVDMAEATVSTKVYESFTAIGAPEPHTDDLIANGQYDPGESYDDVNGNGAWDDDQGRPGVGETNEIVVYEIEYDWPFLTGYLTSLVGHDITLTAAMAVKNEPF